MTPHIELYDSLVHEWCGKPRAAERAYANALRLRRRFGQAGFAIDALAGLLRINIASGRRWYARRIVWGIGQYLEVHGAEGIEEPFRVAESCIAALEALGEPALAERLLRASLALLQERAALLGSATHRDSYLPRVPSNRALIERGRSLPGSELSGTA